ncbi:BREX-1 system adenine-specific DNA-methyltransferase PglX [uncultured Methanobrevibacter sp.]|uniref:BREX-1 system adenine-specific DNA-methyltransferase PglX n=1 Tax=uncultured Methanobrevibacter sp. TaxID=253161 RepID=UPI00345D016C
MLFIFSLCDENAYNALMTPFVWLFLKTYEKLREYILKYKSISSLIQLEYNAFSEIAMVPIGIFIFLNSNKLITYKSTFFRLSDFKGNMELQNKKVVNAINNEVDYKFYVNCKKFLDIPSHPFAYWAIEKLEEIFNKSEKLSIYADPKAGLSSGNNDKFFRLWYEVNINKVGFNLSQIQAKKSSFKWFPINKGGSFRKWYGNQEFIVDYENDGYAIKNYRNSKGKLKSRPQNTKYYFNESINWSRISSSKIGFRYSPKGYVFGGTCSSLFTKNINKYYLLGFLNSSICQKILDLISPTMDYNVGDIAILPLIIKNNPKIISLVEENIKLSKYDWDNYETSWNFKKHPLINNKVTNIRLNFKKWEDNKKNIFKKLKNNEIKLNQIYTEIYKWKINTEIDNQYISINLADYQTDIKSLISYSIGCMFGRYSLDKEGLQFAGGEFNINNYHKFIPDDDNIIPVLDTAYFDDDIVGYFTKFVETCFGSETLEENLDFIADALSKSNKPSREIIRNYLLKNFFNDHKTTYKKCPIYWQFNSGKQNAFNCLIYMHRYEPSLVARIRTDYLHKTQKAIEQRIANNDSIINNSTNKTEIAKATKEKAKLQKQLKETQDYDEVLAHVANQNIEIDLDDGVKVNYAKFQNIEIKKEGSKTKKVNLLKKI